MREEGLHAASGHRSDLNHGTLVLCSEDRASVLGVQTTNWATEVLQSNGL